MKEVKNIKISPIFYMGNKKKLINKGLIDLFPKNINTFVDIFAGSGVVSMNVIANKYLINDIDNNTIDLIRFFAKCDKIKIIDDIQQTIKLFNLPTFSTDVRQYKGNREIHKKNYNELRVNYNKNKNILYLYVLNIFSNSHMLRFNAKNEFNMPFGNGYFTEECKNSILNCNFEIFNNIVNKDFKQLNLLQLKHNDFVYLDPPYFNTTATYNENGGWNMDDEITLYDTCEKLSTQGIKWGMSNVFENKGIINQKLINWCDENDLTIYTFDNFTYCACGKGNSNTQEVYICNY